MNFEFFVKSAFSRLGLQIQRTPRRLWENDAFFVELMKEARERSLLDPVRLFLLYQFALQAADRPGEAAEVGVYRGGTARILARTLNKKTVHLFDTFSGMPAVDAERDTHRPGDFADTSEESVRAYLASAGNAVLHPGFFPQTAAPLEKASFCFVHIDVDIYQSVGDCCRFFYPRLSPGGVLLFDDYGTPTCPGAQQAVDEFFAGKAERPLYLPTGQCAVIKK